MNAFGQCRMLGRVRPAPGFWIKTGIAMEWKGVMPAITTAFDQQLDIDTGFVREHVRWLLGHGVTGVITNGSLGEGGTLSPYEKKALWDACLEAAGEDVPVIASIASMTTADAISQARAAEEAGCRGLMILPPYVYRGDPREMGSHVSSVIDATGLSCMLYNNPVAYGTDFEPDQIIELASRHPNLEAVKESSTDVRRITAIRALNDGDLALFVGVDDVILEGVDAGAVGWVAGLVNALPEESVRLFDLAASGEKNEARSLYEWFLPLLRLDVVPKFVQLIKLVQESVGMGNRRVRPPRLELEGAELREVEEIISSAFANRPLRASSGR